MDCRVFHERKCQLFLIVQAGRFARSLTRHLNGWNRQADEDSDDGNDDEKLNERESPVI